MLHNTCVLLVSYLEILTIDNIRDEVRRSRRIEEAAALCAMRVFPLIEAHERERERENRRIEK